MKKQRPIHLEKTEVMNPSQRLLFAVMRTFGIAMTLMFALWWFNPSHIATNFSGLRHAINFLLFGA